MPQVLAVCKNGHFYPTYGVELGGEPYVEHLETTITVGEDAPVSNCPGCGATGRVLAGIYDVTGDTIKLLQGPERTISELERLREILRVARESGASPEEVGNKVQQEFPDWGPALARLLVPKSPEALLAYITVILQVLEMILSDKEAGHTTNIEGDVVINNLIVQKAPPVPGQHQGAPAPSTNPAYGEKIGRNKPCPCASGRKFKQCHGANGDPRYYGL